MSEAPAYCHNCDHRRGSAEYGRCAAHPSKVGFSGSPKGQLQYCSQVNGDGECVRWRRRTLYRSIVGGGDVASLVALMMFSAVLGIGAGAAAGFAAGKAASAKWSDARSGGDDGSDETTSGE